MLGFFLSWLRFRRTIRYQWIFKLLDELRSVDLAFRSIRDPSYPDYISSVVAINHLKLIPGTNIVYKFTWVGSTEKGGQLVFGTMFQQFLLIVFAHDIDLQPSSLVQPSFDECPHSCKECRRVDDKHAPQLFGVEILSYFGYVLNHALYFAGEHAHGKVGQVENGE